MKRKISARLAASSLLLTILVGLQSFAQQPTIKDGVFTEAQAQAGKQVYDQNCAGCHNERFYRQAWRGWENRNLQQFWFYILGEMPQDNPGFLSDGEYTDVTAYILSLLEYPAGDTPLDPYDGMDQIMIVPN